MSTDISKPISFNVVDDPILTIGNSKKELTIPRIKFKDSKKVINEISKTLVRDAVSLFDTMIQAKKSNTTLAKKDFEAYKDIIKEIIPSLAQSKNYDQIRILLNLCSSGVINDEIINDMQYVECIQVLEHLINLNFEPLKNLSASLQVIATSEK